jgi:electron transfer flavoprotein alpha subunit
MSRDVLLLVDHRDGAPEPVTQQLVDQARGLVGEAGSVSALLLCGEGSGVATHLQGIGLDAIQCIESALLDVYNPELTARLAAEAIRRLEPDLFLCAHTFQGMEVAPWVAASLQLPLLPNCLELRPEGDELVAERLVHGQAWQASLRCSWNGTIVASMARSGGSSTREAGDEETRIEHLDIDPGSLAVHTTVTESIRPVEGQVDISRAEVVVGAGRGVRDQSNLAVVEGLAKALGGVVACSRPLVDLEWMPYEQQVGASGKTIRPRVYIACGISGAAQHLAGITDAGLIIAINQDANAPIFRVAHYGVVADLLQVVPELEAQARRRRGSDH